MLTPEEHDYPAALDYLALLMEPAQAARIVEHLKTAPISHKKAKDIARASNVRLLSANNFHVARDLKKVKNGNYLSPVLLVRSQPLIIADGYHRVCASYILDENADIPCKIVGLYGERRADS
jgi:hypothetical protein